jgi:hypothetical protein
VLVIHIPIGRSCTQTHTLMGDGSLVSAIGKVFDYCVLPDDPAHGMFGSGKFVAEARADSAAVLVCFVRTCSSGDSYARFN